MSLRTEQQQSEIIREFLISVGQSLQQYQYSFACSAELSRHEFNVLFVLGTRGPVVVKEIAQQVPAISLSTLTRLLDSLEDKGYIDRRMDPSDRRSFIISPTDKANQLMNSFPRHIDCLVQRITKALTPEEQASLSELICKIKSQL
ncbi:MarR family winged helix-turn-helix transcriptional regulator [Paenibacillus hexagrammi]|uniref:MarR family transcriptional regulator n=1 Tax=Paenibacillus hexagrammi TaxID=2908839 RepID=A0ABY3SP68_9BACL|nr:MarR family transcriptional regulator [Paenibacillus sp. YPD9-1]UJF35001.1 MarR family transcriptional regulator [Paenibacillus sp. YPD9-1]